MLIYYLSQWDDYIRGWQLLIESGDQILWTLLVLIAWLVRAISLIMLLIRLGDRMVRNKKEIELNIVATGITFVVFKLRRCKNRDIGWFLANEAYFGKVFIISSISTSTATGLFSLRCDTSCKNRMLENPKIPCGIYSNPSSSLLSFLSSLPSHRSRAPSFPSRKVP